MEFGGIRLGLALFPMKTIFLYFKFGVQKNKHGKPSSPYSKFDWNGFFWVKQLTKHVPFQGIRTI
jgi:hypothetical protein